MNCRIRLFAISSAVWVAALTASGCEGTSKEETFGGAGAVACGIGGKLLGGQMTDNRLIQAMVTAAGSSGCWFAGKEIGRYLDDQDREKMNEMAQETLQSGKTQTWKNPTTGVAVKTELVDVKKVAGSDPKTCKTVQQTVTVPKGPTDSETVTACS